MTQEMHRAAWMMKNNQVVTSASLFGPKIDVRPVFEHDRAVLIDLLKNLQPQEWQRPTACAPWLVRDVVAHMLGTDLSRLARTRDGHPTPPRPGEPLPAFIHRFNQDWVSAASRVSPAMLVDLFNTTSPQVLRMWRDLDLDVLGEPVSWAGPDPAPRWLDCARDFTEYWVHQQQIRDATRRPDTDRPTVVHTVLDTFLRALPHNTLAQREDAEGTIFRIEVDGPGGGTWSWQRSGQHWRPTSDGSAAATTLTTDPDTLWRLCVRGIEPHDARQRVAIRGNAELADAALHIVSIIR